MAQPMDPTNPAAPAGRTGKAGKAEIAAFLLESFPQNRCTVEAVARHSATVRLEVGDADLRPGGTVSGPVLMAVADVALYVAILGEIGIVPLTLTTSLNINFLRRPAADRAIVGVCTLLKVGRTLAVGEVALYSEGVDDPVAHAVGTYSIPLRDRGMLSLPDRGVGESTAVQNTDVA